MMENEDVPEVSSFLLELIHRHSLHLITFCHLNLILLFLYKKVCTYLISWTYADKLHTLSWHYKIMKNE